jgi:cytochrome P450 family 142 subfamily A polypeptide 1
MDITLLDRDLYANGPDEAFTWLRANAPVYCDPEGTWGLTLHEDITWAERQPAIFSNAKGSRFRGVPQQSMIDTDDPFHAAQRRLVAKGLGPRQMVKFEAHVQEVARQLVDRIAAQGHCDLVEDIAKPLPMTLIGEMLGADEADYDRLQHWSDVMLTGADGAVNKNDVTMQAAMEYYEYAAAVVAERTANPQDDLVSTLIHGDVDGEKMTHERVVGNALLLLVGGNETTRNVITGGVQALLSHPDQRDLLLADLDDVTGAVEECLRWVTPILNMQRWTTEDVEVRGVTIPAESSVMMCYNSANRDERVFAEPFRFDITRSPNRHIAFGFGPHLCLGASLARLEIRTILTELFRRLPDLRLVTNDDELTYSHSTFVRGIQELHVEFTPA